MRYGPGRAGAAAGALLLACLAGAGGALIPAGAAHAESVREAEWHVRALKLDQVHKITTGTGVTIGLVDTGVDASHPDLAGRIAGGISLDGASDGGKVDTDGHGTSMAGTIVARGGGADHVLGIAPGARLLSIRKVNENDIYEGIKWAADHGAKVVNVSSSGQHDAPQRYIDAVNYALKRDVVIVAGAGNTDIGQKAVGIPAKIPGVIGVGGTGRSGSYWSGAVTGPELALAAPAEDIVSTGSKQAGNKTGFVVGDGTSNASAIVSGAAALLRAKFPDLKAPDVINRLLKTADDLGPPGRDAQTGFGRLNILRALTANVPRADRNPLLPPGTGPDAAPSRAPAAEEDDSGAAGDSGGSSKLVIVLAVLGLLVLVAVVVPIVLFGRRRHRPAAPAGGYPGYPPPGRHAGYAPGPGGYPVPGPGGYPVPGPGGYPPPAAYPSPDGGGYPPSAGSLSPGGDAPQNYPPAPAAYPYQPPQGTRYPPGPPGARQVYPQPPQGPQP